MPSFISEININKAVLNCALLSESVLFQPSGEHTSEEHGTAPWVAFGRGDLILYVAHNWFGDLIKSLGTVLKKRGQSITQQSRR